MRNYLTLLFLICCLTGFSQSTSVRTVFMDNLKKADLYFKNPQTNEDYVDQSGYKHPTYKACPAILDVLTAGYVLKTPCDLTFYEEDEKLISIEEWREKGGVTTFPVIRHTSHEGAEGCNLYRMNKVDENYMYFVSKGYLK